MKRESAWWLVAVALQIAVRRWPEPLRAEMAAEWAAELYEIEREPGPAS